MIISIMSLFWKESSQLFQKHEGENCMWSKSDECWNESLYEDVHVIGNQGYIIYTHEVSLMESWATDRLFSSPCSLLQPPLERRKRILNQCSP